ncbi:cytotoxin [Peptococcaceae bacterium SCADC1_2_3]|nr:cytotoxin [Peptococcaceae bacterium SCADC1_2_3]KFI35319.1 cytotoxin [Peptococcaceae bacterium SCADC1_2_3]
MKFQRTERFKRMYKRLNSGQQNAIKKSLYLMSKNINHPSLRIKRVQGTKDIWEASATMFLRLTFQRENDLIVLRNCGEHDKTLKKP